jgi:glycosyltransferase involved in cell wall biosynthesis
VPYPLEKGDKLRAFNQLKILSKQHEIYLFALNDAALHEDAVNILSSFCKEVHIFSLPKSRIFWNMARFFFSNKPLQCGYFYNPKAQAEIDKLIAEIKPDHIYSQLIRTAEYVKNQPIEKTLDYQDVFSKGMFRLMERAPFWKRWLLSFEYKRLMKYERHVFPYFNHKTIITGVDRDLILHPNKQEIVVVPNGVDFEVFNPIESEKKYDLIFTGNMSYLPNVFAAEYIVNEILPQLITKRPNIRIALCGATPSPRVQQLQNENVLVTGWVENIQEYYAKSRIFIAPMELGTGLQNKLLEAMAMKIPCITSSLASMPLQAVNQKDIIICSAVSDYVQAIETLLSQPQFYESIANNGYEFVHKNYNWEHTTQILNDLICGKNE